MNICYCGQEAGYPHATTCPYPLFRGTANQVNAWYNAREERRERLIEHLKEHLREDCLPPRNKKEEAEDADDDAAEAAEATYTAWEILD